MSLRSRLITFTVLAVGASGAVAGYFTYTEAEAEKARADLRAEVCGRFVDVGGIPRSDYAPCLRDDVDFFRSLSSTVRTRTKDFSATINEGARSIVSASDHVDLDQFRLISYTKFEKTYDPFYFDDPKYDPNRDLHLTKLEVTGVHGTFSDDKDGMPSVWISTSDQSFNNQHERHMVDIDPVLFETFDSRLGWQCRAIRKTDGGCQGTIFIVAPEPGPNDIIGVAPRIAAFDLTPLSEGQAVAVAMYLYAPAFRDATRDDNDRDAQHMKKFLADFSAE